MDAPFSFDPVKAINVVAYIAQQSGASMYDVLKMLYVADKQHLSRYGRFISNDSYAALQRGPVPSRIYDALKLIRQNRFLGDAKPASGLLELCPKTHTFNVVGNPDLGHLSKSDKRCLDEVIATYKVEGHNHLFRISHDAAWRSTPSNAHMSSATIASTLANRAALIQHLADPFPDKEEREHGCESDALTG